MIAEPLPPADGTAVAVAPAAPVAAGPIGRTDLLGGWTIASGGDFLPALHDLHELDRRLSRIDPRL